VLTLADSSALTTTGRHGPIAEVHGPRSIDNFQRGQWTQEPLSMQMAGACMGLSNCERHACSVGPNISTAFEPKGSGLEVLLVDREAVAVPRPSMAAGVQHGRSEWDVTLK
jgi:hypothetical protein